jgi:hypothetical protein
MEGFVQTDPRNTSVEEMCLGKRRMEASCEAGQGPEWAVTPYMDGWTRLNQITVLWDMTPCYLANGVWSKPATCIQARRVFTYTASHPTRVRP